MGEVDDTYQDRSFISGLKGFDVLTDDGSHIGVVKEFFIDRENPSSFGLSIANKEGEIFYLDSDNIKSISDTSIRASLVRQEPLIGKKVFEFSGRYLGRIVDVTYTQSGLHSIAVDDGSKFVTVAADDIDRVNKVVHLSISFGAFG